VDQPHRAAGGFSLLEILVVISILAIAGMFAVPHLVDWRTNLRLRSAVNELKGDLESARASAAKDNRQVYVELVPAESKYKITYEDSGGNFIPIKQEQLPAGIIINTAHGSYSVTGNRTSFNSRGGADNCTIVLTNQKGKSKRITISIIGKIEVSDA
jgi:prepilin-type N-terminal cleavage/methylation domain-containing protein